MLSDGVKKKRMRTYVLGRDVQYATERHRPASMLASITLLVLHYVEARSHGSDAVEQPGRFFKDLAAPASPKRNSVYIHPS